MYSGMRREDFVPDKISFLSEKDIIFRLVASYEPFWCCHSENFDIQSGPLYCGNHAYIVCEKNGKYAAYCGKHVRSWMNVDPDYHSPILKETKIGENKWDSMALISKAAENLRKQVNAFRSAEAESIFYKSGGTFIFQCKNIEKPEELHSHKYDEIMIFNFGYFSIEIINAQHELEKIEYKLYEAAISVCFPKGQIHRIVPTHDFGIGVRIYRPQ